MRQVLQLPSRFDLPGQKAKEKDPQSKRSRKAAAEEAQQRAQDAGGVEMKQAPTDFLTRHRIRSKAVPPLCFERVPVFDYDDPEAAPLEPEEFEDLEPHALTEDESDPELVMEPSRPRGHPSEEWSDEARGLLWASRWKMACAQKLEPWLSPPQYIKDSASFQSCRSSTLDLGVLYGRWAHAVEQYLCDLNSVSIEDRRRYCGRARPVGFKLRPVGGETAVGSAHTDAGVRWWCCIAGRLRELTRAPHDSRRAKEIRALCARDAGALPTSAVVKTSGSGRLKWRQALSLKLAL